MNELTTEQKIIRLLAEKKLFTDVTLIGSALADADIADQIINEYEDLIPDNPECDCQSLSNEEIQVVFDNDEE